MPRNVYDGEKNYIFISYSHKDQEQIEKVLDTFDRNNIRYWYDEGIEVGSEYSDIIAQHIKGCYCVLSFISEHSINSKYCRRERMYGIQQLDKLPLTIYLEDVELSSGEEMMLRSFQTINYFEFAKYDYFEKKLMASPLIKDCQKDEGELTAEEYFNIAMNYYKGIGNIPQDYDLAFENFTKAAEKSHTAAQFYLGECCYLGNGTEQSYEEAAKYYLEAAQEDYMPAQNSIGMCYKYGDGTEIDPDKAFFWFMQAAKDGYADAQNNLALCYEKGIGTEINPASAARWYKSAAAQGNAQAEYNLGICYRYGLGVEQDHEESFRWLKLSAIQGYAQAQTLLGNSHMDGVGVEKNIPEAIRWFKKAADQKIARALIALGNFYEKGDGVEKDLHEAEKWYKEALESGLTSAQARLDAVRAEMKKG